MRFLRRSAVEQVLLARNDEGCRVEAGARYQLRKIRRACGSPHDGPDAESPEPKICFAIRGIVVVPIRPELPKDLRLAVLIVAQFRPLDFEEEVNPVHAEQGVRVHAVLEVSLAPAQIPAFPFTESRQLQMEPGDHDLVFEAGRLVLLDGLRGIGRKSFGECFGYAAVREAVGNRYRAFRVLLRRVSDAVHKLGVTEALVMRLYRTFGDSQEFRCRVGIEAEVISEDGQGLAFCLG